MTRILAQPDVKAREAARLKSSRPFCKARS
jgi:hypothetical protein